MASEDQSFKRGSIFGFTVAEVVLLLLFCLLMALALRLIKLHRAYEVDKIVYQRIENDFLKKVTNDDDVIVIKEQYRKFVEDEQSKLQNEHIKYEELKNIILFAGDDFYKDKSNDEKFKLLKEKMLLGSVLTKAGFDANTDPKELAKLSEIKKVMDKTGNDSPSDAIKKTLDVCESDRKNIENQNGLLIGQLKELGGDGFGIQPCWVDDKGNEVVVYNIEINEKGLKLQKAYEDNDVKSKPMYQLIKSHELLLNSTYDPKEFLDTFDSLRHSNLLKAFKKECEFTARVEDKIPKSLGYAAKDLYKTRISQVNQIFGRGKKKVNKIVDQQKDHVENIKAQL